MVSHENGNIKCVRCIPTIKAVFILPPCTHAKVHVVRSVFAGAVTGGKGGCGGSVHDHSSSSGDVVVSAPSGGHVAIPVNRLHLRHAIFI